MGLIGDKSQVANSVNSDLNHPNYTQGKRRLEAQLYQSATFRRLQQIEDAMHLLGMTTAKRSRGRKAKGYAKLTSLDDVKKMLKKSPPKWAFRC